MKTLKRIVRKVLARLNINIDAYRPRKEYVIDQKRLMPTPRLIFDVGAHFGETVRRYREIYPNAEIYSFEPFSTSFKELTQRCVKDGNCKPFQVALSDVKGEANYFVNNSSATNSLLPPEDMEKRFDHDDNRHYAGTIKTTVHTNTIDSFCNEHNIDHVDILKIDIQGGELKALQGAEHMFQKQCISLVFLEVSFICIYKNQTLFHEIEEFLVSRGYALYNIHYLSTSSHGQLVQGDAIFVDRNLQEKFNLNTGRVSSHPHPSQRGRNVI